MYVFRMEGWPEHPHQLAYVWHGNRIIEKVMLLYIQQNEVISNDRFLQDRCKWQVLLASIERGVQFPGTRIVKNPAVLYTKKHFSTLDWLWIGYLMCSKTVHFFLNSFTGFKQVLFLSHFRLLHFLGAWNVYLRIGHYSVEKKQMVIKH